MAKKSSKNHRAVIMSDKYISESGVQGGKAIADHITLASYIIGIPFLLLGVYAITSIIFNLGFPRHAAGVIAAVLVFVIGLLLVVGAYNIQKTRLEKK